MLGGTLRCGHLGGLWTDVPAVRHLDDTASAGPAAALAGEAAEAVPPVDCHPHLPLSPPAHPPCWSVSAPAFHYRLRQLSTRSPRSHPPSGQHTVQSTTLRLVNTLPESEILQLDKCRGSRPCSSRCPASCCVPACRPGTRHTAPRVPAASSGW